MALVIQRSEGRRAQPDEWRLTGQSTGRSRGWCGPQPKARTRPRRRRRAQRGACLFTFPAGVAWRPIEGRKIVTRHPARVLADFDELKARRCKSIRRIAYAVRCLWRRLSGQGRRGAPGRPGFGEDRKAPCRRPVNDRSGSGRAPKRAARAGTPALRRGVQMLSVMMHENMNIN